MNRNQRRTLQRVFQQPAPTDISWEDVESMLRVVGVELGQRPGSRVSLVKDGEVMVVQRPRPGPLTVRATVRDLAAFLKAVGVKP